MTQDVVPELSAHRAAIRAAAATLATTPEISRTTTVCPLNGAAGEAWLLVELSKAVAEQHGLVATFNLRGNVLTVLFECRG